MKQTSFTGRMNRLVFFFTVVVLNWWGTSLAPAATARGRAMSRLSSSHDVILLIEWSENDDVIRPRRAEHVASSRWAELSCVDINIRT